MQKKPKSRARKGKISRGMSRFTFIVIMVSIAITVFLSSLIYIRYNSTQEWKNSQISEAQANVPPEFAKNTYDINAVQDIETLSKLTSIDDQITTDNGVTDKNSTTIIPALEKAEAIITKNKIEGGKSFELVKSIRLDVDIYKIKQTAYSTPNSEMLESIINNVTRRQLQTPTKKDTQHIKDLNIIAKTYNELDVFVTQTLPLIGKVDGDTITANPDITYETIDSVVNQITPNIQKFSAIVNLKSILNGPNGQIVRDNIKIRDNRKMFDQYLSTFNALSKSQYIKVSSINSLRDAQDLNMTIQGAIIKDGYDIIGDSPVITLSINGEILTNDEYILKSALITATIDPIYKPKPDAPKTSITESESTVQSSTEETSSTDETTESTIEYEIDTTETVEPELYEEND